MAEVLPPKTCSIDRMITMEQDVELVLAGQKTATRRNGRYADVGEMFEFDGKQFRVTNVYQQLVGDMTEADFQSEGYASKEEYFTYISSLHPGMPLAVLPASSVWVHEFKPVSM